RRLRRGLREQREDRPAALDDYSRGGNVGEHGRRRNGQRHVTQEPGRSLGNREPLASVEDRLADDARGGGGQRRQRTAGEGVTMPGKRLQAGRILQHLDRCGVAWIDLDEPGRRAVVYEV